MITGNKDEPLGDGEYPQYTDDDVTTSGMAKKGIAVKHFRLECTGELYSTMPEYVRPLNLAAYTGFDKLTAEEFDCLRQGCLEYEGLFEVAGKHIKDHDGPFKSGQEGPSKASKGKRKASGQDVEDKTESGDDVTDNEEGKEPGSSKKKAPKKKKECNSAYDTWSVKQLEEELKKRGLTATMGNKADKVQRLDEHDETPFQGKLDELSQA